MSKCGNQAVLVLRFFIKWHIHFYLQKENENETENHQPSENLPDISLSKETTLTRKTPYGGQSPPRKKMMGPASKRARTDLPEIPPHLIEDVRSVHTESDNVMNFKLEPEDLASAYDDGNEEFNYDDTNPDISNMSDSADYLMEAKMDMSMKEGKPGTSSNADPSGDNQGTWSFNFHKFLRQIYTQKYKNLIIQ